MSLVPAHRKTPSAPVAACLNGADESFDAPAPRTSASENSGLNASAPKISEQPVQRTSQAVMPNGAVTSVNASGKGLPGEVSIVLGNGKSILVNSSNVRIIGMVSGGFSVITPKATVIYDSGGNELSVIPGAVPPADAEQGGIIFSTETASRADPVPDIFALAAASGLYDAAQAQKANMLTTKAINAPVSFFALP